uniref:Amine oxidase domain-containing protein n=1 Tax=Cyclophora tenuis TaxID=216820 RepID=A0A7S1CWD3_CYCTE
MQSVVCADCPIPEIWMREMGDYVVAVGFLTSTFSEKFLERTNGGCPKLGSTIMLKQLSEVLGLSYDGLSEALVDTRVCEWDIGYMYPKVGMETSRHLVDLAAPMDNVLFAGESTNTNACSTVQAAMDTGLRAAHQAQGLLSSSTRVSGEDSSPHEHYAQTVKGQC